MIYAILQQISDREKERANANSYAAARIGTMFAEDAELEVFLPFPPEKKPTNRISAKTARLLLKFARSGALPPRFVASAGVLIDEAREMLSA